MKKKVLLYTERLYPYIVSFIFCVFLYANKFDFSYNSNIDSLIDGIVTMESIVIGLIGAIIPVVLSMKNESKFVRYVFENDKKGLFKKYLTVTIGIGLSSVSFSLAMYIRDEYSELVRTIIYNLWIYLIFLFLLLTYRSMKYMIIIIFTPDHDDGDDKIELAESEKLQIRQQYQKKN